MLGRLVNEALEEKLPTYPWADTLPLFHNADVRLCKRCWYSLRRCR